MWLAVLALPAGAAAGWVAGRRLRRPRPGGARVVAAAGRPGVATVAGVAAVATVAAVAGGVLQIAVGRAVPGGTGVALTAAGYGLLAAAAASQIRRPGLPLIAAGLLANLVVIVANGGMPVSGVPAGMAAGGHHHGLSTRDHLPALADVIRVEPLGETVSPGDVLVALGGALAVFMWMKPAGEDEASDGGCTDGRRDRPTARKGTA